MNQSNRARKSLLLLAPSIIEGRFDAPVYSPAEAESAGDVEIDVTSSVFRWSPIPFKDVTSRRLSSQLIYIPNGRYLTGSAFIWSW